MGFQPMGLSSGVSVLLGSNDDTGNKFLTANKSFFLYNIWRNE